jgi:hypothetical protein
MRSTATLGLLWITRSQCYSHTHLPVGLTHHEQEQDRFFFFLFFPPINVSPLPIPQFLRWLYWLLVPRRGRRRSTKNFDACCAGALNWVFGGFEPDIKVDGDMGILGMIYA